MDDKTEQLWADMLSGMQDRAAQIVNDGDVDRRNRNWYAREMYGDRYDTLRSEFQRRKLDEINLHFTAKDLSRDSSN
jgi:hypothetical protein